MKVRGEIFKNLQSEPIIFCAKQYVPSLEYADVKVICRIDFP